MVSRLHHWRWLLRYWLMDKYRERLRPLVQGLIVGTVAGAIYFALRGMNMIAPAPGIGSFPIFGFLYCLQLLILIAAVAAIAFRDSMPRRPPGALGVYQWVIQLIIVIISALISYAMRPKVPDPTFAEAVAPTAEDGKSKVRIYGTVWTEDENICAWKKDGTEDIYPKGGKK